MVQNIIINKCIVGMMALFVMLGMNSLLFSNGKNTIDAKIYRYENNKFYGDLIIDDKKLNLIVKVDADNNKGNNEKTYNENKSYNENKQYNEQKEHNINNNTNNHIKNENFNENKQEINKKEEIINKNDINNNENIHKKEEKHNENVKITDDYTPGNIDIVIENGNGQKVNISRKIGSGEMSDIDKELCKEIIKGTMDHVKTLNVPIPERKRIIDIFKGFLNYLNRPKESKIKWFNK